MNGNGVSNFLDYAQSQNTPAPTGPGAPTVVKEGAFLAITYRKLVMANAPVYAVQKSSDLRSWTTVSTDDMVVGVLANVQTIKSRVPIVGDHMFLRVLISPP